MTHAGTDERSRLEIGHVLERLSASVIRRLSPRAELSLSAASTLGRLDTSGPCRITELASEEGVTQPGMTQLVARLAKQGLVERRPDPGDGRAVVINISEGGRSLLAQRRAARTQKLAEMLAGLEEADQASIAAALPALRKLL